MNFLKNKTVRHIVITFAVAFLLIAPIYINGIPDNYDLTEHIHFARTFHNNASVTDIMPKWSGEDNYGFGGAGVRLYPPMTYLLLTIFQTVSGSWYESLWFLLFVCMFVGCVGAYRFVKDLYPESPALAAAVIYGVLPYHLFQIYQVFLLAEYVAASILPFCFLYAARVIRNGRIFDAILFAAAFSALLITHIPTSIITMIALCVYLLFQLDRSNLLRSASLFVLSAAVSLAATSFYWVKVVTEVSWVKHNSEKYFRDGLYDYAVYLFPIFLNPPDFYERRLLWLWDIIIALTLVLFIAAAVFIFRKYRREKRFEPLTVALFATGTLAFLMMSMLSAFVWSSIPFIQKLQFPWRWLAIATFVTSILAAVAIGIIFADGKRPGRLLSYAAGSFTLVLTIFVATQIIIPSAGIPKNQFQQKIDEMYSMNACACWWPVWADAAAFGNKEKVTAAGRGVDVEKWTDDERRFSIEPGTAGNARVATFYYPHWKAAVNNAPVTVTHAEDGTIQIPVPEERSNVTLSFEEPWYAFYLNILSIIAWIGILITLIATRQRVGRV